MTNIALTNVPSAAPAVTNGLRDIKPPMVIPTGWEWVWWMLGAILVVALALGLTWFFLRRRKPVVVPLIPPHIRAKQALEESLKLLSQPKPFVIAVSDTLRGYLEDRFTFRAPERTTEEFLHELQETPLLDATQKRGLGEFLQRCDLVKFAKYEPTQAELRNLHGAAYRLVEETEPGPDPAPNGKPDTTTPLNQRSDEHRPQ